MQFQPRLISQSFKVMFNPVTLSFDFVVLSTAKDVDVEESSVQRFGEKLLFFSFFFSFLTNLCYLSHYLLVALFVSSAD